MSALVWLKNIQHSDKLFLLDARNSDRESFIDSKYIRNEDHCRWFEDVFHSGRMNENYEFFIIMVNFKSHPEPNRIGTISLNYNTGEIGNVIIIDGYKGKGFGSEAMRIAIGMMISMGVKHPFVRVKHSNERAKKFYNKLGFTSEEEIMRHGH